MKVEKIFGKDRKPQLCHLTQRVVQGPRWRQGHLTIWKEVGWGGPNESPKTTVTYHSEHLDALLWFWRPGIPNPALGKVVLATVLTEEPIFNPLLQVRGFLDLLPPTSLLKGLFTFSSCIFAVSPSQTSRRKTHLIALSAHPGKLLSRYLILHLPTGPRGLT